MGVSASPRTTETIRSNSRARRAAICIQERQEGLRCKCTISSRRETLIVSYAGAAGRGHKGPRPPEVCLVETETEEHRERMGLDVAKRPGIAAFQHISKTLIETAFDEEACDLDADAAEKAQIQAFVLVLYI